MITNEVVIHQMPSNVQLLKPFQTPQSLALKENNNYKISMQCFGRR